MDNITLTAETDFFQSINYDHDARRAELATEQAYRDVWLYDRDEEARKRVEANTNAAMYALPSMQDKKGMALWGREHARMVAPHLADTPVELAQNMRDRLVDAGMKERYTAQMATLEASGRDSADDWYSLYAEMYRDVEQKAWDDARSREASVADSLDRLGAYISGADLTPDEEEGTGFSQKDVDNVRSVLPAAEMAALDDMRAFARTYLRGLERLEDGEAIVRGLDDLEDELHEIVGQDENKAALMYNTVMDWAQRVADSDKIGAGDEFLLSVGNKLRTWGQERPRAMFAAVPAVGAAGAINTGALSSAAETIQEAVKEGKGRELSRGILRAGAAKARTIGRNTGWWKGALRMGSAMAGDSAMYLIPAVGGALGTIDTLSMGVTDVPDMARAAGATDFGAGTQAMVGTGVQAAVELMPFGKVGGKGLSAFVRKVFGESVAKGTSGALAKWVVRHTQKSTMRALAAEAGAGMVEEALVEPLVGGVLSLGLEEAVYALGAPQGEQSRKWTEHFAELSSMLTDPQQLAGLAIFTAALTGASTPAIRRNVKYFERSRSMWEAAGLKPEHVEDVLVSKTPMQTGRELLEQEEEQDAAGLWERRAKANEKILAEGKVLFMTGQSEAEMEAPELAQAYAAAWLEGVQTGVLPEVSANDDGTFTVRERGKASKEGKVLVLTPAAADAYLQTAIAREEEAQFEQLKKELGEQGAREKAPNLRAMVQIGVSEIAGEAMRRQVAEHGRFDVADVEKQLPEHLAKLVRMRGGIDRMLAARISDWARGRVAALMEGGMSEHDAWASKDYAAGAVRSLGDWTGFAESFVHRTEKLENRDSVVTQVFRAQNNDVALVDGATVLGSTIFNVRGKGRAFGWLEDTTESVVDQLIQARGVKLYEAKKGEGMTRAEAERQALNELGEQVARARTAVLKADPSAKIFEVKKDDRMSVIESFSDISNSAFLTSGVVPKWMRPMAEMMKANVVAANTALTLAKAWEAAIEADPEAVQDMRKVLDEVGIDVRDIVEETNISAEDIETWKLARAEARAVAYGPRGVGGEAVSEIVQQAEAEEAAIRAKETPVSEERKEEVQAEVRAQEEHVERVYQGADEDDGSAPEEVRGVFVGDSCVYNAAGGFYMGLIDKSKLSDGIEQVKVGAKGKHGVIAGRELVGDFQASAAPLYVWKRKNGELWLISGRHRFELLLRDNGVSSHACYVFVEDAEHDEKWARMMDYENNMRDDQADEVTAAMYVRETGYGDAELRKRGLLRNESRSKRGALIGRWAREELWTRFVNGAVKPMDAEIICNLTKNLRDASRVEEIQRRCCMLLDEGKGWEYIGAMVQLMANKESVFLKQGLLDLGADFEADLARAAAWIEKNLRKLNEAISLVKQGRKLSGKKREEAERLGIATQMEGGEDLLADLEGLRAKFEMVGSYPDLVAQAQLYDGKTEVDPVGQLLEQQRAQREREQGLKELDAEAYLRAKQAESVPTLSFSVGTETYTTRVLSKAYGTDSNGNKLSADTFITTPMGNVDWYRFPQDEKTQKLLAKHGVKNLPIRLRVGKQNNREHKGYGFIHMLSHFDEYVKVGETPLLHLFNTLSNLVKIRGGAGGRYQFKGEYERGRDSLLIAQLMEEDGYYSIVSSYPTQMNRTPRRGELVIGRVLFQFPSNSKKAQIPVGKSKNDAVSTSASTSDQASQEKVAQAAQQVNIYDLQIRNANGEVIFQQGVEPKVTFSLTPEMEGIKAAAEADGTFMKAPNGKATNLTERQWLLVRTKAFKVWFGDWEKVADLSFDGSEYNNETCLKMLAEEAGTPFVNDETGIEAEINNRQRGKITSGKAQRKSRESGFSTGVHNFVAAHIRRLFKHAVHIGDYRDKNQSDDILEIKRFVCPVRIKGVEAFAYMTVKELKQHGHKIYTLELDTIERLGGNLDEHFEEMLNPAPSKEIVARVKALSKTYFENVSKVVDENGEPMVVTHATNSEPFTVFKRGERAGLSGKGIYFSPDGVSIWGRNVMRCFLNVRNPLTKVNAPREVNNGGMSAVIPDVFEKYPEFDGVMIRRDEITVRDPEQVKSATQNRGTFDGSNPDITFSVGEERNLAAVHSLSPEKFLAALELGGMPMPSVAVTRLDKPYSWGGADAINLVGRPEMVDPRKKSKVYMHDAYTGKMPPVMYRKKNREGAMKLKDEALKAIEPYGMDASDGLQSGLFSQDYNESVVDGYYADWGNNRAMRAYWAITQAGYAPKPKMKEAAGVMSAALYKVLKPWEKMLPKNEVLFSYDFTEEILEAFREVMVGHFEAEGKEKLADKYRKMELRDLQGQALDKAMGVRRYTTKKVPDGVENWKRFDAYVSKHAKAYKAWCDEQMRKFLGEKVFSRKFERKNWRGEVVDEWWGHEAYNLKNLMRYMREEKSRGGETESMSPGLFLAVVSEELRSLKDIQAKREQVVGAEAHQDARAVYGQAYNEFVRLTYELKKPGWGGYFEISDAALWRLLELVQGGRNMPTREAVERKLNESKDGWTDKHVDAAMDLLSKVLSMPSDYMEAVPQRAVKMDEWEYAVMPVSLKKNKAVMAGLRENGIRPRFHDGTEEGRRAALAGLVNDSRVSFSVVGENAENWDELKERAFRGRDDGKLRVEIDASQAKLKEGVFVGDAGDEYRRMLAGDMPAEMRDLLVHVSARKKLLDRWYEILDETDDLDAADAYSEEVGIDKDWLWEYGKMCDKLRAYIKERLSVAGVDGEGKFGTLERMSMPLMDSILDGKLNNDYAEELAKMSKGTMYTLKDMLDYPELYKAYPDLRWLPVYFEDMGPFVRGKLLKGAYPEAIYVNKSLPMDGVRSTLLHEIQHAIQVIEEFAAGGTGETARKALEQQIRQYRIRLERLRKELQWINAVDVAKDHLKRMIRILKRPRAILKMGERFAVHEMMDVDVMAQQAIEMMWDEYTQMSIRDFGDTVAYAPGDGYKLTGRGSDVPTLDAVEKLLAKVNALPSRRQGKLRGRGKELERQIEQLYQENKPKLDMTDLSNSELYARLAGEIEARNVQERRDWSMEQRAARPFNATLEYPGEALVTFSVEEVTADWQNTLRGYLNNPPAPGSPEHARDMVVSPTPAVMQMVGAKGWDMVITPGVLDKVMKGKHAVSKEALEQLPAAVSDPICIAVSDTPGCLEVVTELKEGADNVLVAVQLNSGSVADKNIKVNRIASMYGKERIRNLLMHPMVYWNKAKARPWLHNYRLQLPATINPKPGYRGTILKPADLVKYKEERNLTYSMTEMAQNALHLLEKRRDEVEAQVILEDMQKACERLSVVLAADDDPQVGNGLQVYAEMQALISATRKALPGKYLRQGNLNGLLAWAGVYARMAQNGAMPKRGAIKGEIYDRFVTELGKKNERMQLQGMSADEAREVMMGLGSTRLEEAFLKVGRDCAKRLDAFLKDRALERIEYLHELVYPKREPGQAWTRGKMDTTAYLLVEKVRAIIAGSRERRVKLEEELREKRREMRRVREAMESGQLDEEMGARKLTVMRGQMELMELNAMAEAAAKHAQALEQLDQELAELDQDAEDYAQREREINEEVALLKTFGNWYYKDAGEAVRAARVFEDIILRGKADWEDKLKMERERRAWLKAQIASHFTIVDPDVENVRADDRAAFKGTMGSKAKAMAKGVMSFGHMLVYLRKKLGREFCDDQRAKLARIHDGFMGFNRELDGWMYRTLRDITGMDTKEAQEVWLTQMEEVHDTGIMVTNSRREKIVLSYAEAKRWLGLNKEAFEQERARMLAEAAQAKRKPMNVPTAEVMDELRELYLAYEADHRGVDEDKKQFHLTHEETWEEELRTTKGVLLFFLLTFEQPDYEHLLEANGMSGATLDQIRRYIGPKMVRWGYAMRDKLNEHGQLVAEVFERYTGIPFGARESYFKGVFDTGAMKERDERAAIEQGSAGAGTRTKYGSLIPRRYHKARVERVSATQVFVQAMQQQNNYVQTAEFVREWRGLLTDKDFAKRMEAELGADTMQMLRGCIEVLEGAAAGDAAAARAATGVISKMLSGYAVTRLAGNVYSIIKQASAILNAMAGGYVPEKLVEHGVLVQDMALRKVGFGEFLRSLARVLTLRGAIGKSEVAGQEYIRGRKLYAGKGLAHTAMLEANQKVAGYEPDGGWLGWTAAPNAIWSWLGQKSEKVKELGMEALGFMDAEMCTLSAMALADAVYRQGKAEDKEGLVPDEVLRARALQLAGMALDIAAQPQVRTQKGYWAASGAFGALAPTLYMFRSDTLSKVGLWGAQMASGEKLPAATSFLAFGVLNALVLALLSMMRGDLPDDDDEVKEMAVEFALNVLTNDASALPVVGETIGTLRNTLQGKHWAAQGGLGEMVLPFVTLGTDIYREVRNIDKDAPLDKHWATVGRLLRSLGASAAIFHESTTGPFANASSIAAAAAVAGNMSMVVKGLIKAMEDAED